MPIRIRAKKREDGMVRMQGYQMVPCGKCNGCRQRRVNDWVIRLQSEDKNYLGGLFVTLTYTTEHVPLTEKKLMTVKKRDIQLFMKRLRKIDESKKKLKYYCAAEYGSKTYRPHYHLIIFGSDLERIDKAWQLGEVHVGNVTGASIAYTLKYISKEKMVPAFQGDDRIPEFSLMSKNLGLCYLSPQVVNYHRSNLASYYTKEGGFKAALPRYYREKIFNDYQKQQISYEIQKRSLEQYNRDIQICGGPIEYYRLQGERARNQMRILKLKRKNENLKI